MPQPIKGGPKRRNQVPDWTEIRCRFPPKSPAAFDRNQVPVCSDFCTYAEPSGLLLRELRLGNHVVQNVVATISPPKGDLLLGQSFLSLFGTWAIDNARHVLILGNPYGDQQNLLGAQRSGG